MFDSLLVQFVLIVDQLILLGYGLDVVRSVYVGQTDLPPSVGNGPLAMAYDY